jgi:signal transduction histidine kinase
LSFPEPPRPRSLPTIIVLTVALAVLSILWVLTEAHRSRIAPGFYPIGSAILLTATLTTTAVSLVIGIFLAFGRHVVLHDVTSWWIGMGFTALAVAVPFRISSFPIGPNHAAVLSQSPSSSAWILMWATSVFGFCLLAAVSDQRELGHAAALWPVLVWTVGHALVFGAFMRFSGVLPELVHANGSYTAAQLGWQSGVVVLLGSGAFLGVRRHMNKSDTLLTFVIISQITLAFAHLWSVLGRNRYTVISAVAGVLIPSGYLVMVFGLLSDYVSLLRRERRLNNDLGKQLDELRATEAALRRSNTDLEQFAYVASHDLREPLRTMSAYSELLVRAYRRNELHIYGDRCLELITAGARRMDALITDLLTYARVRSSYENTAEECVDLNTTLDDAVSSLKTLILEADATITRAKLPVVRGDRGQLQQVFQNLLENSLKYRRPDVPLIIEIGVVSREHEWMFRFEDNGQGFKPEYAERIFHLFKRLHGPEVPGTGIGLAVCRAVIDRHSGRIWAEAQPGKGTTVFFTLPDTKA